MMTTSSKEIKDEFNAMAKDVTNAAFMYMAATILLAIGIVNTKVLQISNDSGKLLEEINNNLQNPTDITDGVKDLTDGMKQGFEDISNINSEWLFNGDTTPRFCFAAGCAGYGIILCGLVNYSSHKNTGRDFDHSKVKKYYELTDTVPIIDSFLEIPIALAHCFWITVFLWLGFMITCVALTFATFWRGGIDDTKEYLLNEVDKGGSNLTLLISQNAYILYLLVRLTGDTSQFYVLLDAQTDDKTEKVTTDEKQSDQNPEEKFDQDPEENFDQDPIETVDA